MISKSYVLLSRENRVSQALPRKRKRQNLWSLKVSAVFRDIGGFMWHPRLGPAFDDISPLCSAVEFFSSRSFDAQFYHSNIPNLVIGAPRHGP